MIFSWLTVALRIPRQYISKIKKNSNKPSIVCIRIPSADLNMQPNAINIIPGREIWGFLHMFSFPHITKCIQNHIRPTAKHTTKAERLVIIAGGFVRNAKVITFIYVYMSIYIIYIHAYAGMSWYIHTVVPLQNHKSPPYYILFNYSETNSFWNTLVARKIIEWMNSFSYWFSSCCLDVISIHMNNLHPCFNLSAWVEMTSYSRS